MSRKELSKINIKIYKEFCNKQNLKESDINNLKRFINSF